MKLWQLIEKIGDNEIKFQNLTQDLHSVREDPRGALITFATEPAKAREYTIPGHKPEYTALIVWLPTDKMREILDAEKGGSQQ